MLSIDIKMIIVKVNWYGRRKAERFRKRFNLTLDGFADRDYIDLHDYLHTVVGMLPVYGTDEDKVLELEQQVLAGVTHLRGVSFHQSVVSD